MIEHLTLEQIQEKLKQFTKLGNDKTDHKTFFRFYDQELRQLLLFIIILQNITNTRLDWEINLLEESCNKNIPEELLHRCFEIKVYAKTQYDLNNILKNTELKILYTKFCREKTEDCDLKILEIKRSDASKIKNYNNSQIAEYEDIDEDYWAKMAM